MENRLTQTTYAWGNVNLSANWNFSPQPDITVVFTFILTICQYIFQHNNFSFLSNCCVLWHFKHLGSSASLPTQHEKADKFCSEALILAWGCFTCRKSTTRDPQLYFPSEGSHTQDFYTLKKSINPGWDQTRWTSDPEESMITTGLPGLTKNTEYTDSGIDNVYL